MPIKFPDFLDTRCVGIGSCGRLETDDDNVIAAIKAFKEDTMIASYRKGKTIAYIVVAMGGVDPKHIHINVFKREFFTAEPPKPTHTRREIEEILDKFMGKRINTHSFGRFIASIDDLPEGGLVRSTFFAKEQGDLKVMVSGAKFAIMGAPIRGFEWDFAEAKSVIVEMEAGGIKVIDRDYLNEQLRLLDSGFRLFVLGKRTNGTAQTE